VVDERQGLANFAGVGLRGDAQQAGEDGHGHEEDGGAAGADGGADPEGPRIIETHLRLSSF